MYLGNICIYLLVSTLQFFLNRYGLSFTRIGVGMHCHVCMSPKQLLSPLLDPGWGVPRGPGPFTSHFWCPILYSEAQITHFLGRPEMGPNLAKSWIRYCIPIQDVIKLRSFCNIWWNACMFHCLITLWCFVNKKFAQDPTTCVFMKQPLNPLKWNSTWGNYRLWKQCYHAIPLTALLNPDIYFLRIFYHLSCCLMEHWISNKI